MSEGYPQPSPQEEAPDTDLIYTIRGKDIREGGPEEPGKLRYKVGDWKEIRNAPKGSIKEISYEAGGKTYTRHVVGSGSTEQEQQPPVEVRNAEWIPQDVEEQEEPQKAEPAQTTSDAQAAPTTQTTARKPPLTTPVTDTEAAQAERLGDLGVRNSLRSIGTDISSPEIDAKMKERMEVGARASGDLLKKVMAAEKAKEERLTAMRETPRVKPTIEQAEPVAVETPAVETAPEATPEVRAPTRQIRQPEDMTDEEFKAFLDRQGGLGVDNAIHQYDITEQNRREREAKDLNKIVERKQAKRAQQRAWATKEYEIVREREKVEKAAAQQEKEALVGFSEVSSLEHFSRALNTAGEGNVEQLENFLEIDDENLGSIIGKARERFTTITLEQIRNSPSPPETRTFEEAAEFRAAHAPVIGTRNLRINEQDRRTIAFLERFVRQDSLPESEATTIVAELLARRSLGETSGRVDASKGSYDRKTGSSTIPSLREERISQETPQDPTSLAAGRAFRVAEKFAKRIHSGELAKSALLRSSSANEAPSFAKDIDEIAKFVEAERLKS